MVGSVVAFELQRPASGYVRAFVTPSLDHLTIKVLTGGRAGGRLALDCFAVKPPRKGAPPEWGVIAIYPTVTNCRIMLRPCGMARQLRSFPRHARADSSLSAAHCPPACVEFLFASSEEYPCGKAVEEQHPCVSSLRAVRAYLRGGMPGEMFEPEGQEYGQRTWK